MAIFILIKLLHDLDPEVIRHIQLVHQTVSVEVGESPLQLINAKKAVSILVKDVESDPDMLFVEHFSLVTCACQEFLEADLAIIVLIHDGKDLFPMSLAIEANFEMVFENALRELAHLISSDDTVSIEVDLLKDAPQVSLLLLVLLYIDEECDYAALELGALLEVPEVGAYSLHFRLPQVGVCVVVDTC